MSQQTSRGKAYWFQALINRNGVCTQRQGTVNGDYAYQAMGEVRKLAEDWGVPMMECAIYEINDLTGEVGRQLIKSSDEDKWGIRHTCEDDVQPYRFGTYLSDKTFPTFTFPQEDTDNGKDSIQTQSGR